MAKILIVDDEESIRFTFERFLKTAGHQVIAARNYIEALSAIHKVSPDLVVADIILENGGTGIDILREVRSCGINCPVIMITGDPNVDTATEAVRLGAFDYIAKPVNQDSLLRVTATALKYKAAIDEKEMYRSNLDAIFNSVRDPIITVDTEGAVIELNEGAVTNCRFSRDTIGKPFNQVSGECIGSCGDYLYQVIRTHERVEANRIECRSNRGPVKVINLSAYPLLDPQKNFKGVVMVLRDDTRLVNLEKKMEDERRFHRVVGASEKMRKVYGFIEALSGTRTTVLITGESGTGKELVAEALHEQGDQGKSSPLVKVNCSALPEALLESELFGHVKGAFTGAVQDRVGRFQQADGGTIFLDEIGDLSPRIQAELLRVLQEKEFDRVGESTPTKVDVRVVAATNKNLKEKVRLGEFRQDLYYRLKVVEIALPPLRERRDDIPLLVDHFRRKFNQTFNRRIDAVSDEVMNAFLHHDWPGNVRELEHAMEHAQVLCTGGIITLSHLPEDLVESVSKLQKPVRVDIKESDHRALVDALQKVGGNKAKAARLLGINRATLYRWMERFHGTGEPNDM